MKAIKQGLLAVLISAIAILLLPIILCGLLCIALLWLIRYPFCNAKYKKSHYFKDFGISIAAFVYDSEFYTVYNAVREADLPLTPVLCRDHKNRVIDMLFFYGDTLLYVNTEATLGFDVDQNQWTAQIFQIFNDEIDGDETVEFIEYMNKQTDDMLSAHPDCPIPNRRVILVDKNLLQKHEIDRAMETPEFLVYDKKDPAQAIREWMSQT